MACTQNLTLSLVSQDVLSNTSVIRVTWTTTQTGTSYNGYSKTGYWWTSVNGGSETLRSVTSTLPKNTTKTIIDTTLTVSHNQTGDATVRVRTSFDTGISAGTITLTRTITLPTIPRASDVSVPQNGTIGSTLEITAEKQVDDYVHQLLWFVPNTNPLVTGYITEEGTYDSGTSWEWTAPPDLAQYAPATGDLNVGIELDTYFPQEDEDTHEVTYTYIGASIGETNLALPDDPAYKPSIHQLICDDVMAYKDTYGGLIQGLSKPYLKCDIALAYSSPLASVVATFNGSNYALTYSNDVVISGVTYHRYIYAFQNVVSTSGALAYSVTARDARGNETTAQMTVDVIPYAKPSITRLSVNRCREDGTEDLLGDYCLATFSYTISQVVHPTTHQPGNQKYAKIKYKRNTTPWSDVSLTPQYSVENATIIFPVSSSYSFSIALEIWDSFTSSNHIVKQVPLSTGYALYHVRTQGDGITFGGIAEESGLASKMPLKARNGFYQSLLVYTGNLDNIDDTQTVYCTSDCTNLPSTSMGGYLRTVKDPSNANNGYQEFDDITNKSKYFRFRNNQIWDAWDEIGKEPGPVPDDYIVSEGTSGIWAYRKWNSGKAECWCHHSMTSTWTATRGYQSGSVWIMQYMTGSNSAIASTPAVNYPFTFLELPRVYVTYEMAASSSVNSAYPCAEAAGTTSVCPRYGALRPSNPGSSSYNWGLNMYVVGKWK